MNLKAFLFLLLVIGLSALNKESAVETIFKYWNENECIFEEDKQTTEEIDDFELDIMFENNDYDEHFLENIIIESPEMNQQSEHINQCVIPSSSFN